MRPFDLRTTALAAALALGLGATADARVTVLKDDPYPSTYERIAAQDTLIRNATVLVGDGTRLENADVLLRDGKVARVGQGLDAPRGSTVVDGTGKWITPGLIDVHSHLGVYASPGLDAHSDGNEMTNPVTPQVWAEHAVWPQDPGFGTALAGGVTSMLILPGSGNLIGGRGVVLKNVPGETYQQMKFPGAPWSLKMACGENPKRFYGGQGAAPMTRMGNVAGYRNAFIDAREYLEKLDDEEPPKQDLRLETLAAAMNGEIQVQIHCYRADEACWLAARVTTSTSPRSSISRWPRSTTASRPTRSPIASPRPAPAARSGPTGGASRPRPTTRCRRTSSSSTAPTRAVVARWCIRIPPKASSA